MALFGPTAVTSSKNLIEFRAGQVNLNQNKAVPCKQKGLIYLKLGSDNLVHFCWQNRESKNTLDDFTIIPGDAVFKNIDACTTGRVYALYIASSKSKQLYWMQEPSREKDKELVEKVNHILSNPAPTPESERGHGMLDMLSSIRHSDMFEGMDQNLVEQILQSNSGSNAFRQFMNMSDPLFRGSASTGRSLFSSSGQSQGDNSAPSSQAGTGSSDDQGQETGGNASASGGLSGFDIQNLVSGIQLPESIVNRQLRVQFSDVITYQALDSLLADPGAVTRLEALLSDSPEPLSELLRSPQFTQALGFFSEGFISRQLAPLMNEYGREAVTAAQEGDLVALARAIEQSLDGTPVEEGSGQDIVDDNDDLD